MVLNSTNIQRTLQQAKELKKRLVKLQRVFPEIMRAFLSKVYDKITSLANNYVEKSDIGSLVKTSITTSWEKEFIGYNTMIIRNKSDKSAFVEFGVGIVGENAPDPASPIKPNRWQYNLPSYSKDEKGYWGFYANTNELNFSLSDTVSGSHLFNDDRKEKGIRGYFITRGAEGVFFLFNALTDVITREKEEICRMFNETIKEYMGQ